MSQDEKTCTLLTVLIHYLRFSLESLPSVQFGRQPLRAAISYNSNHQAHGQNQMKKAFLIAVVLASYVSTNAGMALDPKTFPGKGSKDAWKKAGVLYDKANALADASNWDGAIGKYQEAIAVYPFSDTYQYALGVAYEKRAKKTDSLLAEKAYRKAVELCPTDARNWNGLAGFFGDRKLYKECKSVCDEALQSKIAEADKAGFRSNLEQLNKLLTKSK